MSMLSSQCDELRQVAQIYRNLGKYATEQMLRDAADTILELRDDLQRANRSLQDAEHDESVAWDRVRKAERENVKLRELAAEMLENLMPEICEKAYWCRDKDWRTCSDMACGNYTFVILAQELGIEVDG